MLKDKTKELQKLESEKSDIERQKSLLEKEVKKFQFSSDENIVKKFSELSSILDNNDVDIEKRMSNFIQGAKTLTQYLEKYSKTITVIETNASEVARKTSTQEVSFKLYPDIFKLKPVSRNGFFDCLSAPTGVGKTRFILNLMYHKYLEKKVTYFFSFEMTEEEIVFNLLAIDVFYRSFNPNTGKYELVLSKEQMELEYKNTSEQKKKFYDSRLDDMFSFIRLLWVDKPTPKNVFFGMTYKQEEHGEEPEFVFIDHFHLMISDDEQIKGEVAIYSDVAKKLYMYAKKTNSVFFILGQMDNKEKDDPKHYEESGWKWCGDFPTYVQHYWKLFADPDNRSQWLLYNAKLRNDVKVYEPYQIKFCPSNGAIMSSKNEHLK